MFFGFIYLNQNVYCSGIISLNNIYKLLYVSNISIFYFLIFYFQINF